MSAPPDAPSMVKLEVEMKEPKPTLGAVRAPVCDQKLALYTLVAGLALICVCLSIALAAESSSSTSSTGDRLGTELAQLRASTQTIYVPPEGTLPGVARGKERPSIILAQDIDYPPYAYLGDATEEYDVDGFGHDFAERLVDVCDINVTVVQTNWANCWGDNKIGTGLLDGWYHGCMTYTHTVGVRNRYMEFSEPILRLNKAAGIITRLNDDGTPHVSGSSTLEGLKVIDVVGWAPTADGLSFVANSCVEGKPKFSGFEFVDSTFDTGNKNDDALKTLLNGTADVIWLYADQAKNYKCSDDVDESWDCAMWEGLGSKFAYIHTGLYTYAYGGTTLSISKKGSGLKKILDPCIQAFKKTKAYYDICVENDLVFDCFDNEHFPPSAEQVEPDYDKSTAELTSSCAEGYCSCPAA